MYYDTTLENLKEIERKIEKFNQLNDSLEDIITLIELSIEADDESDIDEIKAESDAFKTKLEDEKLSTLLTGDFEGGSRGRSGLCGKTA